MSENNTNIDSWDGVLTNFLKAEDLDKDEDVVAVTDVKLSGKDMELTVWLGEKKYSFSLNVTNKVFLKENGIKAPKDVIGKRLTLRKGMAMNPTLKKEVPSLRISKVE
jgi:hypothetical protein